MPKASDAAVSFWEGRPPADVPAYTLIGQILGRDGQRFGGLAACRDVGSNVFDGLTPDDVRQAVATCAGCLVRARCLDWTTAQDEQLRRRNGFAGGYDGVAGGVAWGRARKLLGDDSATVAS